jgi:tetratricopeptide (TPR) repeat protein
MRFSPAFSPRALARRIGPALVVVFGCWAGLGLAWAQAPASAPADTVRPELAKPLMAAQAALRADQFAEVLAKLKDTDAVSGKTPYEVYVIERTRAGGASGLADPGAAADGVEAAYLKMAATGKQSPAEALQFQASLARLHYRAAHYAKSADWSRRALQAGSTDPQLHELRLSALYLDKDYAAATTEIQADIQAGEAAGKPPTEERLQMLGSAWLQLKDMAGYAAVLEKLVALYPKPAYWADLIQRTARKPGFADRLWLDALRLQQQVGALTTAADVMDLAQSALDGGSPFEARLRLDQGFANGVLGVGDDAASQKRLREAAIRKAIEEDKSLAQGLGPSAAAKSGVAFVNVGLSQVFAGKVDKGLALIEQGLAKGNFKYPDEAWLRAGLAYVLAGQKDKAVQAFKHVEGSEGGADLARLWLLHLQR